MFLFKNSAHDQFVVPPIGGVVRMNVSISPGGAVQSVLPLGGSPPLMDAAVTAVKKWKYEPAFGWTNIEVRLRFIP